MGSCWSEEKNSVDQSDLSPSNECPMATKSFNIRSAMQDATMIGGIIESHLILEDKIRRAKHEMKTVTVSNGCLYIDYQYQGHLPEGFKVVI